MAAAARMRSATVRMTKKVIFTCVAARLEDHMAWMRARSGLSQSDRLTITPSTANQQSSA